MPSNTTHKNQYSDAVIASIEMVYGEGFLSPGGEPAVARIVNGIDLTGCDILEVGCGLGGVLLALVNNHGVRHVHGIDLEAAVLERATKRVEAAGIVGQVKLEQTDPGPIPVPDNNFDAVMCRAMLCHIEDKPSFYEEIIRTIRPGGYLIGSDWYLGVGAQKYQNYLMWNDSMKSSGLDFYFAEPEETIVAFENAGFDNIMLKDDTNFLTEESNGHLEKIIGPSSEALIEAIGIEGHQKIIDRTKYRIAALSCGALMHMRFQMQKPD